MPPELPIGPDDYLHMRSLGHGGAWAAVIMHRRDGRGPAYFSGQDRRFSRARQERKDKGRATEPPGRWHSHGALPHQPPARWLLFVSAVEACNDQQATRLSPGEAYILSQHKGSKRWDHRRVMGPVAQTGAASGQ